VNADTINSKFLSGCEFNKSYVTLKTKIFEQSTLYFDEEKRPLEALDFQEKDLVIPILYIKGVFVDSTNKVNYRWTICHLLRANKYRRDL
jgi:hypothetical protein